MTLINTIEQSEDAITEMHVDGAGCASFARANTA
jgi:hypothetical protein